ncbi:MAG: hypothetical protein JWQ62_1323, partial [Lacunisphaera sp.]|nr:hypothetical protein [Lacunisphaera sp.]
DDARAGADKQRPYKMLHLQLCWRPFARAAQLAAVEESELNRCCALLEIGPRLTNETLERAYMKKNFAAIRGGSAEEREQLRVARDQLAAHLKAQTPPPVATPRGPLDSMPENPGAASRPVPVVTPHPAQEKAELCDPLSFDSWLVNLLALPLILGFAWLINQTPLVFLLRGFHIWMHEFGHATVAWLTGHRALPLPIGWTSVEPERSNFVYFGVLFLLGVLLVAGWKERKIWPILLAVAIAPVQFYMTWRMPEYRADLWLAFGGVAGEFWLSALLLALFYVQFPDKFRWEFCRYFFAFLGASTFLNIFIFWRHVKTGTESIPWGSMVQGEEDGGGDMNILRDDYGWNNHFITNTYNGLGAACIAFLVIVYLVFALRLDRVAGRFVVALWPE